MGGERRGRFRISHFQNTDHARSGFFWKGVEVKDREPQRRVVADDALGVLHVRNAV